MAMDKIITLLFALLLTPVFAFPQYHIQGKITDEKGTGVKGASIYLYKNGELTVHTHSAASGEYHTGNIPQGKYNMVISHIGFRNQEDSVAVPNQDVTLDFILETESTMLDSVVVEGRLSRTTSKGYVFYLSQKAKESGNPFVALQEIPLIYSDPINESVRSADGQAMAILIDGMRVNSGISPIDPSRIKSVEIEDVVGAKYMRQGVKRVMNIKLKKTTSLYTYEQLSARADYPKKDYFIMPKFEIGNSSISFYGDASPGAGHSRKENRYSLVTPVLAKEYWGESENKNREFDYSFMTKWRMGEKDYLAAYIQGNISKETNDYLSHGEQNKHSIVRNNTSEYHSHLFSATAYYKHLFAEDEELEAYAVYSDNRADNTNNLEEHIDGKGGENYQKYSNDRKLMTLTLDYSKDFDNGGSLNFGNETQYSYDRIESTGTGSHLYGHHRLNEFVFAGYSGQLMRRLTYNAMAGMEYVSMKSDSISHHYLKPRMSLHAFYNITNSIKTGVSYRYSNTAPDVTLLNPYNTSADTLLISRGNPFLMPSKTHTFGIDVSYFDKGLSLSANMSYGISNDIAKSVSMTLDNGGLLTTYRNEDRFRSLKMQLNLLWLKNGYTLLMNTAHNVDYYTTAGAKKYFTAMLFIRKKWGDFEVQTSLNYQNYIHTEFSRTKNFNPTSTLVLSYGFTPDIVLSVGCTSFIGNPRSKTTISTGAYRSVSYSTERTFTPWILFRWTLRKNDKTKIDFDNDIMKDHEGKIRL
ncbi:hypothetical protein JCM15908A_11400 [Prevotella dentasini JCM 15908]